MLFIVCTDYVMSGVMEIFSKSGRPGVTIRPRKCSREPAVEEVDQEYADDTVLYCRSTDDLDFLHGVFKVAFETCGLTAQSQKMQGHVYKLL